MPMQPGLKGLHVEDETLKMFDLTKEMLDSAWEGFRRHDKERLLKAEIIGREIHEKEKVLTCSILKDVSRKEGSNLEELSLFIPSQL